MSSIVKNKGAHALIYSLYQKQKRLFLVCSHGIPLFSCGFSYDFPGDGQPQPGSAGTAFRIQPVKLFKNPLQPFL